MEHWQRRFFTFWGAQAVSMFGSTLAQFAITWWLTQSTGSATVLAIATVFAMLPGVILGPLVGVLVDRWKRQAVIVAADTTGAIGAGLLMLLFWTGSIEIWHVYAITLIRSLAGTFHFAAVQSSTSLMVPDEQLSRVAGLNQTLQGLNLVVAPPLGALLLELFSLHWMMAVDVVTALIAVVLVLLISIPQPKPNSISSERLSIIGDLKTGFVYIWRWPGLLMLMGMSALLNFIFAPAFSLLPILVTNHFKGNAWQLATLNTTLGLGFVTGGIILGVWGGFKRKMYTSMVGLAGLAVGSALMGLAPAEGYWVAVVGMAIFGVLNPIANGPLMALLQSAVAPEMQGRFFTVLGSLSAAMAPLGLLVAGPLADRFGVQVWFLVGTVAVSVMVAICLMTPMLRKLEDHQVEKESVVHSA